MAAPLPAPPLPGAAAKGGEVGGSCEASGTSSGGGGGGEGGDGEGNNGGVGLVYDEVYAKHEHYPSHPESPERVEDIWERLRETGVADRCERVPVRPATVEELRRVHSESLVERVSECRGKNGSLGTDCAFNEFTCEAAFAAAGGVAELALRVARGELASGAAAVRPPGHHAGIFRPAGFCYFNNVAVATAAARAAGVGRVAIVDWDVHHGNGTQEIFLEDPNVLYFSVHRAYFYPGTGHVDEVGEGLAVGRNINVPVGLNGQYGDTYGDPEFMQAFTSVLFPVAREFAPDLVIVSAGFDAVRGDPLGGLDVTPGGFVWMLQQLLPLAGGKIVLALEGGYDLDENARCFELCTRVLLGEKGETLPQPERGVCCADVQTTIARVVKAHAAHWKCFGQHGESGHDGAEEKAEAAAKVAAAADEDVKEAAVAEEERAAESATLGHSKKDAASRGTAAADGGNTTTATAGIIAVEDGGKAVAQPDVGATSNGSDSSGTAAAGGGSKDGGGSRDAEGVVVSAIVANTGGGGGGSGGDGGKAAAAAAAGEDDALPTRHPQAGGKGGTLASYELVEEWTREQARLKALLVAEDKFDWTTNGLPAGGWLVAPDAKGNGGAAAAAATAGAAADGEAKPLTLLGGVDISFVIGSDEACASLVVVRLPDLAVVYEAFEAVQMTLPYVSGFLAFREVGFLVSLLERLRAQRPELFPQVVLVDGNGVLHPRGFGLACHLGVLADVPTIGVGKTFLHVDGLTQHEVKALAARTLRRGGDAVALEGDSGDIWGAAMTTTDGSRNPIYVSRGHRLTLDTAIRVVRSCCRHRMPEPVRQADLRSREYLRKHPPAT